MSGFISQLASTVDSELPREERARIAAELVRSARDYRWVGVYDVGDDEIVLIAHTGSTPPEHLRFSIDRGLSGDVVRTRSTVVCNDVVTDPRYLSAFSHTRSEVIVPVLGPESGIVIGTLDVESERLDAFGSDDVGFLEDCAAALRSLYD